MSKITPKNLSYDDTLPPFLQRLRANNSSLDGRNSFQSTRPKKPRNAEDEAEDEPVYFDEESGETLSKTEWEAKELAGDAGDGKDESDAIGEEGKEGEKGEKKNEEKERMAAIGVSKKRKVGKVVGGEEDEQEKGGGVGKSKKVENGEGKKEEKVEKAKNAKKGKKIKLSFGDDE